MTDAKRPVDQAVELVLYAPLGFALEARRLLPSFVQRGKQQVQMARMIGQFAVRQGQSEAQVRLTRAQEQAEVLLNELGLRLADQSPEPTVASAVSSPVAATAPRSSAAAAGLAVDDYDSLAASQVIPRLPGLEADELEAVRTYESAHRGRKTILGKVAQLQGT